MRTHHRSRVYSHRNPQHLAEMPLFPNPRLSVLPK